MKKVVLLLAIICATGISSFSQQVKLGHINGSELIKHMKEYKDAVEDLKKKSTELQSVIEYMSIELDSLQNDYGKNSTTWAPVIREMKEKNIIQKNQNLQEFQQTAQSQLQMDEQDRNSSDFKYTTTNKVSRMIVPSLFWHNEPTLAVCGKFIIITFY